MKIKDKKTELTPGTRKTFEKLYEKEKKVPLTWSEDEIFLYDVLAGQDVDFENIDELLDELAILRRDWGGQKFFYETPGKGLKGKEIKRLRDVSDQSGTNVKLYSARSADDVQKLYDWAKANRIATTGFDDFVAADPEEAPFKGHFGDRAHTVKHYHQKRDQGSRLICLHLNASGSKELRATRDDSSFIRKGGEGNSAGGFGLKSEHSFVSVALGKAKATWDHVKHTIAEVELVR